MGRSRGVVKHFLNDPVAYSAYKLAGRSPVLTEMTRSRLLRAAQGGELSARELYVQLELPVSVSGVKQLLNESPKLKFLKRTHALVLTDRHKTAHVKWCADRCRMSNEDWTRTIFLDKKKFNLDGPDRFQGYWHDLRKEKQVFSTRQFGGGLIMVWGTVGGAKTSMLSFLEGKQNSEKYVSTLENYLLPFFGRAGW